MVATEQSNMVNDRHFLLDFTPIRGNDVACKKRLLSLSLYGARLGFGVSHWHELGRDGRGCLWAVTGTHR